jgi:ABC-type dipeptide/oligopeptide/nickel transport system permease component
MILGVILLYGVFLTLMNLAVDLVYGFIDPRIRY